MAKLFTLLLAALVILSLLVSPISCTRKLTKAKHKPKPKPAAHVAKPKPNPVSHKPAPMVKPKPNPVTYKPAPAVAKPPHRNHTSKHHPIVYSSGWLSGAGATYYGAPNGDGSDGQ